MQLSFLGPSGSQSHLVAEAIAKQQGADIDLVACPDNVAVLQNTRGNTELGVVAIENNQGGLVTPVVRDFWFAEASFGTLRVIGEFLLPVSHHLLVRDEIKGIAELSEVMSHPQALEQCSKSLATLGLNVTRAASSTSVAAQQVAENADMKHVGVLATERAAEIFGLKVLQKNMEDSPDNVTRFHILGHTDMAPTGRDRTAIRFVLPHQPRALADVMWAIGTQDNNLSSIHSIPIGNEEYVFYAEYEGHRAHFPQGIRTVDLLKQVTQNLHILGSYPQA